MCVFPYFVIKVQFSLKKRHLLEIVCWIGSSIFFSVLSFLCITVCTLLILPFYNQSSKKHVITSPLFSHHQKIYRVYKLKLAFWKKKTWLIEAFWWIWGLEINVCKFHLNPSNFVDSIMGHSVGAGRANKTKSKIDPNLNISFPKTKFWPNCHLNILYIW